MSKEKETTRVYKYTAEAKNNVKPTCPACRGRMWFEDANGACAERYRCVCGYSNFRFTGMAKPDFDMMALGAR